VVIWGWLRRPVLLGAKNDLCMTCGRRTTHGIFRVVTWAHVFWFPFLPLWIGHVLLCTDCGRERQKLGWRQVRSGLRSGKLPLGPRPEFRTWAMNVFDETGRMPQEAELDPVEPNPKRGPWDLWLKAWPLVVAGLVIAVALAGFTRPAAPSVPVVVAPSAHVCWHDRNEELIGCRMDDGTVVGSSDGYQLTCYFTEPMPTDRGLYCD
jgi:hypothetical protein